MSNEKFTLPFTSNRSLSPKLGWINNSRIRLELKVSCLKQDKAPFSPNNVVNWYIAYELNIWSQDLNVEFTLKDCLFGAVKLTKGYEIRFDSRSFFQFQTLIGVKISLFLELIWAHLYMLIIKMKIS